jgi:hypothetical protein
LEAGAAAIRNGMNPLWLLGLDRDDYTMVAAMIERAEEHAVRRDEAYIDALSTLIINKLARAMRS